MRLNDTCSVEVGESELAVILDAIKEQKVRCSDRAREFNHVTCA